MNRMTQELRKLLSKMDKVFQGVISIYSENLGEWILPPNY